MVKEQVKKFFDSDVARIFNEYYKAHGAERLGGISAVKYNELVSEELEKHLGKTALKDMTLQQAKDFLARIKGLPASSPISKYNNAVRQKAAEAMKKALKDAAEKAAASSLDKVVRAGAKKGGVKMIKAIPLVGTVVAVYFYAEDAEVYGGGPATVNSAIDAVPLLGTGKVISEALRGYRFLDVTVGPQQIQPSEKSCAK